MMLVIKELLKRHKKNKRELDIIADQICRLNERLENIPVVSGKVTKSSDEFPYIEEHLTVKMQEPKEATIIKNKLREKEARQTVLSQEITAVGDFIDGLPEGINKRIMEQVYVEGKSQEEVAALIGYTKGRISQIIRKTAKD